MTEQPDKPKPLLVKIEQAAEMLCVKRSTLYRLIRRGELPTVPIGSSRRVAVSDIQAYIDRHREKAA